MKLINSLLTGVPVQTRYSDGLLTPAGGQQRAWHWEMCQKLGKRKSMVINVMGGKRKITRKELDQFSI